jgi:glycosyltransferase involved in cell wall biosynthesis
LRKVWIIRSNPVNPDSRVEKLALTLKEQKYDIKIFAWDREKNYGIKIEEKNLFNKEKIDIYRKGIKATFGGGFKKNIFSLLKFQISLLKSLIQNRKDIDIVHACDFDTGLTCFIFAKMFRKKIIYDIFDYYLDCCNVPKILYYLIKVLDNFVINNSDVVVLCNEQRIEQIEGTHPKKIVIIHNTPIQNCKFQSEQIKNNINRKIKIVYVGIFMKKERMLEELMEVVAENKEYELHIAGFGEIEEQVKEYSKKSENIKYYGKISYVETLELESNCDIMVAIYNPNKRNHYFAAPNKFYEALMLGKPLIMVKGTGMSEIIEKNKLGEVIQFNKFSLKEGLKNLSNCKKEWESIGKKMKKIYTEEYSWNEMRKRIINLYKEVSK